MKKIIIAATGTVGTALTKKLLSDTDCYMVRVSIPNLNICKDPSTNYSRTKYIPVGSYTIVEETDDQGANKWGRLKSGAGWISLDYCYRIYLNSSRKLH